jgi:hypothetical protein
VCVPAVADVLADVSVSTLVLELEPSFSDSTPVASVRLLISVESVENRVPKLEIAVSWLSNVFNWVFHGVSTFCRLATIEETVVLTLKPSPLVGDPKLSPTTLIAPSG